MVKIEWSMVCWLTKMPIWVSRCSIILNRLISGRSFRLFLSPIIACFWSFCWRESTPGQKQILDCLTRKITYASFFWTSFTLQSTLGMMQCSISSSLSLHTGLCSTNSRARFMFSSRKFQITATINLLIWSFTGCLPCECSVYSF
jgi:hypothetical protein